MRGDVQRDLSRSTKDFQRLIWPLLSQQIGSGELVAVESIADVGFAREFDMMAGIDFWQIVRDRSLMRGIGSRVQWVDRAWNTFTIRDDRDSGTETEWLKRLRAILNEDEDYLLPALTVHGYVTDEPMGRLLSVGACYTRQLLWFIVNGKEGVDYGRRRTDNAWFRFVDWRHFAQRGAHLLGFQPWFWGWQKPLGPT